ncbi:hypothetical protein SESBI_17776 [Sesbania bispinosa]|nr:hypothetical protein SESBI_17776 [Sesbania bispinosa]
MKWWTTGSSGQSNKQEVKLSQLKLDLGLFGARFRAPKDKVAIEITGIPTNKGKPPSSSLVPFHRTPKRRRYTHTTSTRRFLCSKTPSHVWDASDLCPFNLQLNMALLPSTCPSMSYMRFKAKMTVVGKVSMTVFREEMKTESNSHHHLQRRVSIHLKVNGLIIEASFWKVKYLTSLGKKNNGNKFDQTEQTSPYESDGSPVFDSDDSSNVSTTSSGSSKSDGGGIHNVDSSRLTFLTSGETKTRLDTLQRSRSQLSRKQDSFKGSEKASGESACTVLVALIAHWLHSNKGMPTRAQFDSLIRQGSSEWRRLCNSDYYSKLFPDKHFDLETIIEANLRPLIILPQKSYTGKVVDYEPRIYILSWNDHFFVLKIEADAYYIIDSLGERLFEGCQQAFILKFDDSCVMYGKVDEAPSKGNNGAKNAKCEERLEIVCRGKECCKEFIKRFLAAIPLRQLEKEEKKWNVSSPYLHRQLQIEFHYSSSLPSSTSTSAPSSMLSFLTNGHLEA